MGETGGDWGVGEGGGWRWGGGQKGSENFVTGGESFVCWVLENVTNSGLNVVIMSQKCHLSMRIFRITFYSWLQGNIFILTHQNFVSVDF